MFCLVLACAYFARGFQAWALAAAPAPAHVTAPQPHGQRARMLLRLMRSHDPPHARHQTFEGQRLSEKVDVYSFAMLLFEMATGARVRVRFI